MERPEKKEDITHLPQLQHSEEALKRIGYNKAIDAYEKFLPGEGEIVKILVGVNMEFLRKGKEKDISREEPYVCHLAKAIHNRIQGIK